jgi:triacylglycerol lipase
VLLHGAGGFNKLENLPLDVSYFNGVQQDLIAHGEPRVFVTIAPPFDSSEERARAIAPALDDILRQTGALKLNLIGHSQGGLDARVIASDRGLGYGDRIASVTTIGAPHRGSQVADASLGLLPGIAASELDSLTHSFLQLLEDGFYDVRSDPHLYAQATEMTAAYMTGTFNPEYVDDPRVSYMSYAGRTNLEDGRGVCDGAVLPNDPNQKDAAQPMLTPTATFLEANGEVSDGLVPVESARWGEFMGCIPADHLKEVGLLVNGPDPISGFDHLAFFRDVVARLRARGL